MGHHFPNVTVERETAYFTRNKIMSVVVGMVSGAVLVGQAWKVSIGWMSSGVIFKALS